MKSSRKNILMINDHIHFGGGGDAVFRLERRAYEEAGHEVFTFSFAAEVPEGVSDQDIVYLADKSRLLVKAGKFLGAPHVHRALKRLLMRIQPDLIRVHLVSKYPSAIYPVLEGYPVIQTLHGPNLFCATSWGNLRRDSSACELGIGLKCWNRGCVSFPTALLYTLLDARVRPWVKKTVGLYHCPSRQIQAKAESLGYQPTIYLPLGVDPDFIDADPATHNGPPIILYVGGLIEEKGVLLLPDALLRIKQKIPSVKLIICGRGPLVERLKHEFAERNLSENVDLKGFIDHWQVVEQYRRAHVLVCPSIYSEQFGLVGPEALACGVPCVGSHVGGIPEWLHHNEWGYLVPPRDSLALADRVTSLLQDRELRLRFGRKGRNFVLAVHHPNDYQKRWLEIAGQYPQKSLLRSLKINLNHES